MSERLTAEQLVSNFRASVWSTRADYGNVTVVIELILGITYIQINWPSGVLITTLGTLQFASDLTEAARIALECERLLTEAGYTLYRKESPETEAR